MLALFRGDIQGYLEYNSMAVFIIIAVILLLHLKHIKRKKLYGSIATFLLVLNMIYYLYRVL